MRSNPENRPDLRLEGAWLTRYRVIGFVKVQGVARCRFLLENSRIFPQITGLNFRLY